MKNDERLFAEWVADEIIFTVKGKKRKWTREEMEELALMLTHRDDQVKPKAPTGIACLSAGPINILLEEQESVTELTKTIFIKRRDLMTMRGIWIAQFESWEELVEAVNAGIPD